MTELLTREEAAALLKVHPRTLDRWRRQGTVPARKVGGLFRYDRDEMLNAVARWQAPVVRIAGEEARRPGDEAG